MGGSYAIKIMKIDNSGLPGRFFGKSCRGTFHFCLGAIKSGTGRKGGRDFGNFSIIAHCLKLQ
jgi:hypothetical protein